MAFVVVYDACVLHGNTCRDLLIRVGQAGLVQAKWSEQILDELIESLEKRGIGTADKLARLRRLIAASIADSLVTGHDELIESLRLPDPNDRHVLAAAIRSHAQVIVTDNTKDFPASALESWGIEVKTPDDFVRDLIGLDAWTVHSCVRDIVVSRSNPPVTMETVLAQLERSGLVQTAGVLRLGPPDGL